MVTFDAGLISGLLLSVIKADSRRWIPNLVAVIVHGHLMTKVHAHFMWDNLECSLLVSCARFAINVS